MALDTWYRLKQGHEHTIQTEDADGDSDGQYKTLQGGEKVEDLPESTLEAAGDKFEQCPPPPDELDLDSKKKKQLLEIADQVGISNTETNGAKKDELKALIRGALS